MNKVPVFILSGFLGSGKTTLLHRLLEACSTKRLKPAVLMNEIGETDTDGKSLAKEQVIEKLLDGCICCNKKSEVTKSMERLVKGKPNVIFIELTGIANPEEVADSLTEPALLDLVYLEKVITVVDAEHVLSYNNVFESDRELVRTTRRQVEVADYLIVNKIDFVSEAKKQKVKKFLLKHNPNAKYSFTTYSQVDLDFLSDLKTSQLTVQVSGSELKQQHKHRHSYSRISSITLPLSSQTTKADIEAFLKKWKTRLLRAKGYVRLGEDTYLMQHVMKRVSWEKTLYEGELYLVFIGMDLQEEQLKKEWGRVAGAVSKA
ncbi:CobW family GTP-binding protein [Halalkalibacter urbisdiaboli]|uniref:CobW family GTP-binding protein n=1 Tax=Halalkalibacter urbisdiaboli TaxID=1960589 RepID=UPI000B43C3D1|nr:GTP-binding protein [Halalkalibacter urbisdiaboli]